MKKKEQGITLIALVVTIIILIILAGISISVLLGENGLIAKAQQAKTDYLNAQDKELGEMADAVYEIDAITKPDLAPGELELIGENTYEINSIEDLLAFAYSVNIGEEKYLGKTIELGRSLDFDNDLSYANPEAKYNVDLKTGYFRDEENGMRIKGLVDGRFVPIGSWESNGFYGRINGNNNVISHLRIGTITYYGGLIGKGVEGKNLEINDLGLEGGSVMPMTCAGGILCNPCGANVSINNCYCDTLVYAVSSDYAGGIIGVIDPKGGTVNITNCYNNGTIRGGYAGGIIGVDFTGSSNITNCYNTGMIKGEQSGAGDYDTRAGGIIGEGAGKITNCYNTGEVSGGYVGGILGRAIVFTKKITNCYNAGNVTNIEQFSKNSGYAGGIIGMTYAAPSDIENCYNTGEIAGGKAGGAVGYFTKPGPLNITNFYNTGTITAEKMGKQEIGIAGAIAGGSNINGETMENLPITVTNSYYKTGTAEKGIGASESETGITPKTADQMKSPEFLTKIKGTAANTAWKREDLKNEGMPILSWQ